MPFDGHSGRTWPGRRRWLRRRSPGDLLVFSFRAALVASQVLGLAFTRYVLELDPLVQAGAGDLATAIGPTLERYLTGRIR